jgi:hypothetical protein
MSDNRLDVISPVALVSSFAFKTVERRKGLGNGSTGYLSHGDSVIDLQLEILELFGEAQQRSSYSYAYNERSSFTVRRGHGASIYHCEMCGSTSETHRCVIPDRVPPEGFTCSPCKRDHARTASELEIEQIKRREYYRRFKLLHPRGPNGCGVCGARAPQHRCIEKRDGQ